MDTNRIRALKHTITYLPTQEEREQDEKRKKLIAKNDAEWDKLTAEFKATMAIINACFRGIGMEESRNCDKERARLHEINERKIQLMEERDGLFSN